MPAQDWPLPEPDPLPPYFPWEPEYSRRAMARASGRQAARKRRACRIISRLTGMLAFLAVAIVVVAGLMFLARVLG